MYNRTNPLNGAVLYMQYQVGGANTAFTFNSFDLRGPNLPFTVEGFRGGVLEDSTVLSASNNFSTYALNWANIDTVEIVSTSSLPVNWGSGTLYMDNVVLNNPVESIPEPASLALLGMGLAGLGFVRRRGGAAA